MIGQSALSRSVGMPTGKIRSASRGAAGTHGDNQRLAAEAQLDEHSITIAAFMAIDLARR
jgi:hypothetical protein